MNKRYFSDINYNDSTTSNTEHSKVVKYYVPVAKWSTVALYIFLTAIACFSFFNGCNRNPYREQDFNTKSYVTLIDSVDRERVVNEVSIVRFYDKDSLLTVNNRRYLLDRIGKEIVEDETEWLLTSFWCSSCADSTLITVEERRKRLINVAIEAADTSFYYYNR